MIERVWQTYVSLFDQVRAWAAQFLDDDNAQQLARDVLAEEFMLASRGFMTPWGVLESVRTTSMRVLARYGSEVGEFMKHDALWAWPMPTKTFIDDVSWLWGTILHVVEETYQDEHLRMNVMAGIRLNTPDWLSPIQLSAYWNYPGPLPRRLHTSWRRFTAHQCQEAPVCRLAEVIHGDECTKGLRWMQWEATKEAGETWLKLQRSQSS